MSESAAEAALHTPGEKTAAALDRALSVTCTCGHPRCCFRRCGRLAGVLWATADAFVITEALKDARALAQELAATATSKRQVEENQAACLRVARWCLQTLARADTAPSGDTADLLVNGERVSLRAAFLNASPLLSGSFGSWRGRAADDPLQLLAPDSCEWWWNAETLVLLERAVLDVELGPILSCDSSASATQARSCTRLWKLAFAFLSGPVSSAAESHTECALVVEAESRLLEWLKAQSFTFADVSDKASSERKERVDLALDLLSVDESGALRTAAATRLAFVAPRLIHLSKGGQKSPECAAAICRALNGLSPALQHDVVAQKGVDNEDLVHDGQWILATLKLAALARCTTGCQAIVDKCIMLLGLRYPMLLRIFRAPSPPQYWSNVRVLVYKSEGPA